MKAKITTACPYSLGFTMVNHTHRLNDHSPERETNDLQNGASCESPWYLPEIPAYAPSRCIASVCKRQGFGGLSAISEIRRSTQTPSHGGFYKDLRIHPRPKAVVSCVGG
jgi:hypothetical protein